LPNTTPQEVGAAHTYPPALYQSIHDWKPPVFPLTGTRPGWHFVTVEERRVGSNLSRKKALHLAQAWIDYGYEVEVHRIPGRIEQPQVLEYPTVRKELTP
jgi:hypothetical protein